MCFNSFEMTIKDNDKEWLTLIGFFRIFGVRKNDEMCASGIKQLQDLYTLEISLLYWK